MHLTTTPNAWQDVQWSLRPCKSISQTDYFERKEVLGPRPRLGNIKGILGPAGTGARPEAML